MMLLVSDNTGKCNFIENELRKNGFYIQTVFPYKNVTDRYNIRSVPTLIDDSNNCLEYNEIISFITKSKMKLK